MAKASTPLDEQLSKQDFDLFAAITALDHKDYDYYDRLTPEQQKKFVPFMMVQWMASLGASGPIASYYVQSTNHHANLYLFDENIQHHPKLVWLMLCAASPGLGKQYHKWVPHIKERVSKLKEPAKTKDISDFYKKIYSKISESDLKDITRSYIDHHKKRMYIAEKYPALKFEEIELLAGIITDEDIQKTEEDHGNI